MRRDAWYAAIAALGLCSAAAAYAFFAAPKLADPKVVLHKSQLTASLPSPPRPAVGRELLAQAQTVLEERDPFTRRSGAPIVTGRGLDLPKLGRPVQFPQSGETAATARSSVSAPVPQTAAVPRAPVPQQTAQPQGSLTLRGVYPTSTGGRALVAMPDGSVVSVGVGGVVGGWRVLQIQQGAIRLGRGQRAIMLAMPR